MRTTLFVLLLSSGVAAQSATARAHTLLQNETSAGGTLNSTTYVLDGAVGAGVTARRTTSANYVLEGGFTKTLDVTGTGRPWITAVVPRYTYLLGKATVRIQGTELHKGNAPKVRVGGTLTPLVTRSAHEITTTLPIQSRPGWLPLEVQTDLGTTVLQKGIGVLPLLETDPAPTSLKDFDLVFRGTKNDVVLWAMSVGQTTPLQLPGAHFGFALSPAAFLVFSGFAITRNDGVLRIPIQGRSYPVGLIYLQALFISTHKGYAPGSFSNVIRM